MGFPRENSSASLSPHQQPSERRCCNYKNLNLVAFAGTLVYIGYLFGSSENGVVNSVNDAFTNSFWGRDRDDASRDFYAERNPGIRAASASSSWDRISASASWDGVKASREDPFERKRESRESLEESNDLKTSGNENMEAATPLTRGPVIHSHEGPVTSINLIGERHSGTNWITDHLIDCFEDQIKVETNFTRYKHWFQFDDEHVRNESAVVIAMFRDPYDWVEAMRERPHHAHDHIGLEWKEFVTKPWVGPRGPADIAKMEQSKKDLQPLEYAGCLAGYKFDEVIPCSTEDSIHDDGYSNYMYELNHDGSHRAYGSIVDLRREKILNFMQVPNFHGVRAFFPERYEALNLHGTAEFLKTLEEVTGLEAKCEPFKGTGVVKNKVVDPEYVKWMNKFADWDTENLIGYERREPVQHEMAIFRLEENTRVHS